MENVPKGDGQETLAAHVVHTRGPDGSSVDDVSDEWPSVLQSSAGEHTDRCHRFLAGIHQPSCPILAKHSMLIRASGSKVAPRGNFEGSGWQPSDIFDLRHDGFPLLMSGLSLQAYFLSTSPRPNNTPLGPSQGKQIILNIF